MTVASNFTILTTLCEQNKQTQQVKMSKIGVQQSTLCYNLNHYKIIQRSTKRNIDNNFSACSPVFCYFLNNSALTLASRGTMILVFKTLSKRNGPYHCLWLHPYQSQLIFNNALLYIKCADTFSRPLNVTRTQFALKIAYDKQNWDECVHLIKINNLLSVDIPWGMSVCFTSYRKLRVQIII